MPHGKKTAEHIRKSAPCRVRHGNGCADVGFFHRDSVDVHHRYQGGDGLVLSHVAGAFKGGVSFGASPCCAKGQHPRSAWLLLVAVAAAIACSLTFALAVPCAAFADEEATAEDVAQGNSVNLQQRPDSSFLYDTSIEDLAQADTYLDGQTVQVVGEAVGDNVRASLLGDRRWITLESEDGTNFISVFMTESQASQIEHLGQYGVVGTSVQVKGTYHLACKEHEGLSDLHAETVQVVEPGQVQPDEFNADEFMPGVFLVALGLFFAVIYYYFRERQR